MHCTACSSWFKIGPINEMNRIEWRGNNFKNSLYLNNINCTKSMTLHKTKVKLFFFTRFAVQLAISSSTNSYYSINPTSDSVSLQYHVIIYFTNIFQKTFFRYFWIFFLIKAHIPRWMRIWRRLCKFVSNLLQRYNFCIYQLLKIILAYNY